MRRYIKTQIKSILDSLQVAERSLKLLVTSKEIGKIPQLLQDMQDAAIQVGETIEASEGEGPDAVSALEQFCEILWEITQVEDLKDAISLCNQLEKKLTFVRKSVEKITEQVEVVFLPYKACMWDSLEGAWKEAIADENNSVYVIPVPYYDKNLDGSFRQVHYEADQFPETVKCTHFDDYNFEKHHPDIIYIHNPYDEYNNVTSVHPFFYSAHLVELTEKLVYIPYFVHPNGRVIEEYVCLPGVLYADEVVLESEEVVQKYADIFAKEMEGDTTKFKCRKSSKLQASDDHVIPEEWNKYIYKKDGSKKKIIFFNTHLSCITHDKAGDFFVKAKEVFETFKSTEDVAILWRPHPLTIPSAESMNPEAIKPYQDLVQWYKDEDFGIYDDTSDVHRAVDISDAYYGSMSSVVEMFKAQKKPIMIMNLTLHE